MTSADFVDAVRRFGAAAARTHLSHTHLKLLGGHLGCAIIYLISVYKKVLEATCGVPSQMFFNASHKNLKKNSGSTTHVHRFGHNSTFFWRVEAQANWLTNSDCNEHVQTYRNKTMPMSKCTNCFSLFDLELCSSLSLFPSLFLSPSLPLLSFLCLFLPLFHYLCVFLNVLFSDTGFVVVLQRLR